MKTRIIDAQMISKLFFRLLPIQILLCMISVINSIVSSLFASNFIGTAAMSAVGLYLPINMFLTALSTMLVGGSQVLCGKYMGMNQVENTRRVFSLDVALSVLLSAILIGIISVSVCFGFTSVFTDDADVLPMFNKYLLGQAIGILPLVLGSQLSAFLSLENNRRRTIIASIAYIAANVVLNFLFVGVLRMEAFGLALASSLGLWIFFLIQGQYFMTKKALMRFEKKLLRWREARDIVRVGIPGAASTGYQALRGVIVNMLIVQFVGSAGLSAFAASDTLLRIAWAVPSGMVAVSRMLMSISVGEEDRETLKNVMKIGLFQCTALMCVIAGIIIAFAVPLTNLYYRDPTQPVYQMTVWGFRLLPVCMPLAVIYLHFVCNAQVSGRQVFAHVMSAIDGVIVVVACAAVLVPLIGMNGVYIANVINGIMIVVIPVAYAWIKKKRVTANIEDIMVMSDDFGVPEDSRIDISVRSIEEVVNLSERVQDFCAERGIDGRRSYLAGLFTEEMLGNVVRHGFAMDRKKHAADVRIVKKNDDVILSIKDDCAPFDPAERQSILAPDDITKNIGIRMVYSMAREVNYQNILGLNVLKIRI